MFVESSSILSFGCSFCRHGPPNDWLRFRVALRLAVCNKSGRLGFKPIEAHGQRFIYLFAIEPLLSGSLRKTPLTRVWVCLLIVCLASIRCTYCTYSLLLKILRSATYTRIFCQSRPCKADMPISFILRTPLSI